MKRKILCFLFAIAMLFSIIPLSVVASEVSVVAGKDLYSTEIEDDFNDTFAGAFDVSNYSYKLTDDGVYLISIMESKTSLGGVELYFYIYNPSRKTLMKDTSLDKATLAVYSSENNESIDEYLKYDITLLKTYGATKESGSETNALILKYRLVLNKNYSTDITRYYRVSEIELLFKNNSTAVSHRVGKEFKFFNDKKGYVNFTSKDLTTLEMEAYHTFYRVNTKGVDRYTDIQSVYFAVPNELLDKYGGLYSMDCSWAKASTNLGIAVDDYVVLDSIQKDLINGNSDCRYGIFYDRYWPGSDGGWAYANYSFAINTGVLDDYIKRQVHEDVDDLYVYKWSDSVLFSDVIGYSGDCYVYPLKMVFYSDNVKTFEEKAVPGEDIINYIDKYSWQSEITDEFIEDLFNGNISSEAFEELVSGPIFYTGTDRVHTFTVEQPNKELMIYRPATGWEWFWKGSFHEKSTHEVVDFSYFEKIDLADLNKLSIDSFSEKYKVDKYDVSCGNDACGSCLKCNTSNPKYDDCTWFLLRYDTTTYQSYESLIIDSKTGEKACESFTFYTEVIKGFDTISLTLSEEDDGELVKTVFPLSTSPTNFSSDAWSPSKKPDQWFRDLNDTANDWWELIEKLLKIILGVLIVIVFCIFFKFIWGFVKGGIKVLSAPIKKINNKKSTNNRKDKK